MKENKDIQIRDPFVFTNKKDRKYYLFESTDKICGEKELVLIYM